MGEACELQIGEEVEIVSKNLGDFRCVFVGMRNKAYLEFRLFNGSTIALPWECIKKNNMKIRKIIAKEEEYERNRTAAMASRPAGGFANQQAGANDVGGGNMVIIKDAQGYQYKHLHMKYPSPLKPGDTVIAGSTVIGYVGHTGKGITVPHLHFTVITPEGKTMDGAPYLQMAHDNIGVIRDPAGLGDFGAAQEITLSQDDLELLATIIKLEAGGESYEGQLAVGTVIMNRVASSNYANTVRGVLSSRGAFSTWAAAKKNPHNYTQSTMRAAQEVLAGKRVLPRSVVFFRGYGPSETPKQYWYGPLYTKLGNHYFYHSKNEPGCPADK